MKLRMGAPDDGARTSVFCATAPELAGESGRYYEKSAVKEPGAATTTELGEELWEKSEAWTTA
jgi:hypothetical protein